MNTQMQRVVHGSDQEEHRLGAAVHNPGLQSGGEHTPHDDKKSVLKKVKAKAKKIKDTITKHGHHGHGHGEDDAHQHHRPHNAGAYHEDDDEEEEIEVDPEVHGAPIYESKEVRRTFFPGQVASSVVPNVTVPQPTPQAAPSMAGMGHYGTQHDAVVGGAHGTTTFSSPISVERRRANISNPSPDLTREEDNLREHRSFIPGQVGVSKHNDVVTFGGSQTHAGVDRGTNLHISSGTGGIIDRRTDLEPDPHAPRGDREPSNYQSKVQDPSREGGEEMGITQILHSLDKMTTYDDETKQRQDERKRVGQEESMFKPNAGLPDKNRSLGDIGGHKTSEVLTATPTITDKGISAKNAIVSKLGFGGEGDVTSSPPSSAIDYGKNVASTVYEKLAEAGGVVMSKMPGSHETAQTVAEKVSPGEEDKVLSDVITEKLHKTEEKDEVGKVTFSAKVVRQLGREGEESAEDIDSGVSGPAGGEPMVNMLKDTVTSWLGIKHDPEPSSLVWHDIPKDTNEGLSGHNNQRQQLPETERKARPQ